jgi:demethylmenaquinone methyltransferase/2-methoxy-6-polyprenyl-1,4-benzoquinol methylase
MARRYAKMARAAQERRGGPDASVIVLDYNAEMIMAGVEKGGEPEITWTVGDAMALPLPDASVPTPIRSASASATWPTFRGPAEARRVLKPGGRFLCLEFSRPTASAIRQGL